MTSVNKGVKRNQYIPPSFTLPLFPQLSSHLPSAPSHLYLSTPSRSCALSPSSVLHSFVQCPRCHSRSGIGPKTNRPLHLFSHRRLSMFASGCGCDQQEDELLVYGPAFLFARWLCAWPCEDGLDIITDRERWWIGNGSGGGTRWGRLGSSREEDGACCFKSKGDNREDEESMEGSIPEMSF